MTSSSLLWFLTVEQPPLPSPPLTIPARENYTSEEVSGAVAKLVQGSIRRPYGALGERQTNDTFDDTMDAAAGVLILTPEAPFYVILLGARRLNDTVSSISTSAFQLLDAIVATGRRVRPVENITSLGNARTALQALESATAARSSAFGDIEDAPAFQRFDLHTTRFLTESATNIKEGSNIVQTPQEARSKLAGLVSSLISAFTDVQRRVRLLSAGIEDYNSLNLPALLSQGVISKARGVLQDRIDQLDALSPSDRLEHLRDAVLEVLASKAAVRGFGSLTPSGVFVPIEGLGVPFTDEDHLGTAALISSDILDPYPIVAGADVLEVEIDGGPTTLTLVLPKSFIAKIEGTAPEPFVITGTTDTLRISYTGFSNITFSFSPGSISVESICTLINGSWGGRPLVAEPYFNPEKFNGAVNTQNPAGPLLEFVKLSTGAWSTLGVAIGDKILVIDSSMAGSLFQVTILAGNTLTATMLSGSVAAVIGVTIAIGPFNRFLRIRVSDAGALAALTGSTTLGVVAVTDDASTTLGFFPGSLVTSRRTRGDEIASVINASLAGSVDGVPRFAASAVYSGGELSTGRSETTDPLKVVSSIYRAVGDVTTGGLSAVFSVAGAASAGVEVGDIITLRSAAVASQVGRFGTITAVSDISVSATMASSASLATGLNLEFGLDLNQTRDQILRIDNASPLAGDYRTVAPLPNPSEVALDRPLPFSFSFGGQGFTFQMSIGSLRMDFESLSTDVDSELLIDGTGAPLFFNPPVVAVGSTRFVLFEKDPKVLSAGDLLEYYHTEYNNPEFSIPIRGFERGQKLIELDEELPMSILELDFATEIEVSFARVRKAHRNNYDTFKSQLDVWLELDVNQEQYFRDLNRFINPLLVNENPTLSAVSTAKTHLEELTTALGQLQVILSSYQVDSVPRVDTLVNSFLERGSDRAVDTLLEGRFRDFFGYNSEEVSYIGDALERLRDVSRLDLPVRRKGRKEVIDQELTLGQFEEPDFEFDQSDTQDFEEPEIPGQFLDVPGSSQ